MKELPKGYIKPMCPECESTLIDEQRRVTQLQSVEGLHLTPGRTWPHRECDGVEWGDTRYVDAWATECSFVCADCGYDSIDLDNFIPEVAPGIVTPGTANDDPGVR